MAVAIPQLPVFPPSLAPLLEPHVPVSVTPCPVVIPQYSGPVVMCPAIPCLVPQLPTSIPPYGTNLQSFGVELNHVETGMGACGEHGESRHEHDDRTLPSGEKGTRISQPHVDEICVSDEEPKGDDIVADDMMDEAEKMQRDTDTELSDIVGLQDHLEEGGNHGNVVEEWSKEVDNGPMTYTTETLPKSVKASLVPNPDSTCSTVGNDCRNLLATECSKKTQSLARKLIITLDGTTHFVSVGMVKKYGFQRMR